jgi:TetR/AcrR family transcriptional repressor of bet genes
MARPSNSEARRSEITRALMKVMSKRGYDGATIADIAKAAKLTPGLVHYHFESKQEILLELLSWLVARRDAALEARLAAAKSPVEEVEAFIDFHLGLGADADPEALACWILLSGEALRDKAVRAAFEAAVARSRSRLAAAIRRGKEQGLFSVESVDAAAGALVALGQGYFVLAASAPSVIERGSAAAAAKRMASGLLYPSRPPKRRRRRA